MTGRSSPARGLADVAVGALGIALGGDVGKALALGGGASGVAAAGAVRAGSATRCTRCVLPSGQGMRWMVCTSLADVQR
jgi:hypothetical protein|nr:hypothetical protein [Stenotrophomonas lactitubi]